MLHHYNMDNRSDLNSPDMNLKNTRHHKTEIESDNSGVTSNFNKVIYNNNITETEHLNFITPNISKTHDTHLDSVSHNLELDAGVKSLTTVHAESAITTGLHQREMVADADQSVHSTSQNLKKSRNI